MRFLNLLTLALAISACGIQVTDEADDVASTDAAPATALPDLAQTLECLPKGASLTVAHRGTQRGSQYPENSLEALDALIMHGTLIAEIDVAQTRDGVPILFHDGVWNEGSNGAGAVAATEWRRAQTFSLRDTRDRLTDSGVPRLVDYLDRVDGKLYLEIDFKSSADFEQVIDVIEKKDLIEDVILIAYSAGAARKLRRLAPNAFVSVPAENYDSIAGPKLAWTGEGRPSNYPLSISRPRRGDAANATLHVTDTALDLPPVQGLVDPDAFKNCLRN